MSRTGGAGTGEIRAQDLDVAPIGSTKDFGKDAEADGVSFRGMRGDGREALARPRSSRERCKNSSEVSRPRPGGGRPGETGLAGGRHVRGPCVVIRTEYELGRWGRARKEVCNQLEYKVGDGHLPDFPCLRSLFFLIFRKPQFKSYCSKKQSDTYETAKSKAIGGVAISTSSDPPLCLSASPGIR